MDFTGNRQMPSLVDAIKTTGLNGDINSGADVSYPSASGQSSMPWYAWLLLLLIVCFIGTNLYLYLNDGYKDISSLYKPFSESVGSFFGNAKDEISNKVNDLTSVIFGTSTTQGQPVSATTPEKDAAQTTSLYNSLNKETDNKESTATDTSTATATATATPSSPRQSGRPQAPTQPDFSADDSASTIQQTKSSSKAGWCYIGEDRGFRSCIKVNDGDTCMSGNIFPSQDLCVNPNLRV
jgi:hypothetical protein